MVQTQLWQPKVSLHISKCPLGWLDCPHMITTVLSRSWKLCTLLCFLSFVIAFVRLIPENTLTYGSTVDGNLDNFLFLLLYIVLWNSSTCFLLNRHTHFLECMAGSSRHGMQSCNCRGHYWMDFQITCVSLPPSCRLLVFWLLHNLPDI